MIRSRFDAELIEINKNLIKLGSLIEVAIELSIKALLQQDKQLAESVIKGDKQINSLAREIEGEALKVLLCQQPVASDLRTISTALKIVTDMERIGDQAQDICEIVLHLCNEEYQTKLVQVPQMAEKTKHMVGDCINSFVNLDIELAKKIIDSDDEIDSLFAKVKADMVELIKEKSCCADQAIYLMMVAKYFEKIGDHAENIAEWIIFCKTGERKNVKLL